nr:coat protein [Carnation ringspot virus]
MTSKQSRKSKMALVPKQRQNLARTVKTVKIPYATTQIVTTSNPPKKGQTKVSGRQLFMSLINSSSFVVNNGLPTPSLLSLNPSNQYLFPSLAYEAANYDLYRFTKLRLSYVHDTNATVSGRVSLMWDRDSQDVPPNSRVSIPQCTKSVSTAVYESCAIDLPIDDVWRFVRDTDVVDRKLSDYGQIFTAVHSGSTTVEVGDVYLDYTIELKDKQPTASMVQTAYWDVSGVLAKSEGPRYFYPSDVTFTSTMAAISLQLSGIFNIQVIVTCTTAGTLVVGGNTSVIGVMYSQFTTPRYFAQAVLACTGVPNGTPSVNMTGFAGITRITLVITRASAGNALP